MKIYIIPVPSELQPKSVGIKRPPHNRDYGVEQDFLKYLKRNPKLLARSAGEADYHYLPIFWVRLYKKIILKEKDTPKELIKELDQAVSKLIINDAITFTVCQYEGMDQQISKQNIQLGKTVLLSPSRREREGNIIDIPLLSSPHKQVITKRPKKYKACFNGNFETHPIRLEMAEQFSHRKDILIKEYQKDPSRYLRLIVGRTFVQNILSSYVSLCPRGTSASSYRFYESMQLGVTPCFIGDMDVRPFKDRIDWDSFSFFVNSIDKLEDLLNKLNKQETIEMGKRAYLCWRDQLRYQKWCSLALEELKNQY
jgi:hypothetical protein